jgi:hypothetical protein
MMKGLIFVLSKQISICAGVHERKRVLGCWTNGVGDFAIVAYGYDG